jgi:hypothetical protein
MQEYASSKYIEAMTKMLSDGVHEVFIRIAIVVGKE